MRKPLSATKSSTPDQPGRVMHDVICSNCGKLTEVPFVPTGSRPVYCQDCFQTVRQ